MRDTALEGVLNDLFATEGILIRESFTLRSEEGHPVEQIDGALEVDGSAYLVKSSGGVSLSRSTR
ncbi:hypothetical protein ACPCSF_24730 [Streptomyces griseoincarnatus]